MIIAITTDELRYAGYDTPVATLQTVMWTGLQESLDAFFDCFTPEVQEEFQSVRTREAEQAKCDTTSTGCLFASGREQLRGLRVYAQHVLSDTEVELEYELDVVGVASHRCRQPFRKLGEAWRVSGPPREV
jgi:hypothetical protein